MEQSALFLIEHYALIIAPPCSPFFLESALNAPKSFSHDEKAEHKQKFDDNSKKI